MNLRLAFAGRSLTMVLVLTAVCAAGIPAASSAAVHTGTDVLGLATAPDETGLFSVEELPLGAFDLHLLVYGYDHPQGIVGWECRIVLPDGVLATDVTLEGKSDASGVDLETGALRVFPHVPLEPIDGVVHLATLHLMLADDSRDQEFLLAPYPDNEAKMGFSIETSEANVTSFAWPDDCQECPVFVIIASPEPVISSSWGGVKSLYR